MIPMMLIAGAVSCVLSLALTPMCRALALRFGKVDRPDRVRKLHAGAIPRVGGVAIFVSFAAALAAAALLAPALNWTGLDWSAVNRTIPAAILIFLIGLLDDLIGLTAWQKLGGQCAAAIFACASGVQIEALAGHSIANTWWHEPLTVAWLIACSNAFNLIDGVDGLAAGVGLVAALTTFGSAIWSGNASLALAAAAISGALLGFLRYNFNPATIFLGDCGSLTVGFLLGCFGVIWSQKAVTMLGMTAPMIALCLPFVEVAVSIARRFLRGQPIFGADRRHIHHRLLDRGLTPKRVALVLYGAAGIAAACSLLASIGNVRFGGLGVIACCIGAWVGIQRLHYSEFEEARRVVFGGVIARVINDRVVLRQFDENLRAASPADDCWEILADTSRKLGIEKIRLEAGGRARVERLGTAADSDCWQLRIPLDGYGVAEFSLRSGGALHPATLAPFADIVRLRLASMGPWVRMLAAGETLPRPVLAETEIVKHG
jgi:UDP-GlcNAc:undecaprenyl-phosphate/decaprenyl-phosphate GlcNAc-1-phosphate transferase